jgi:ABC-type antimicrobial peptide transport system permease subunit
MDLLTVYRLLGIKKRSLLSIFCIESVLITLKYSLPTIIGVWIFVNAAGSFEALSAFSMIYPVWAAALTLVAILIFELIISVLPTLRLLALPPARLAAKYDL